MYRENAAGEGRIKRAVRWFEQRGGQATLMEMARARIAEDQSATAARELAGALADRGLARCSRRANPGARPSTYVILAQLERELEGEATALASVLLILTGRLHGHATMPLTQAEAVLTVFWEKIAAWRGWYADHAPYAPDELAAVDAALCRTVVALRHQHRSAAESQTATLVAF